MRRFGRWALNTLTALSLLLCATTVMASLAAIPRIRGIDFECRGRAIHIGLDKCSIWLLVLKDWPGIGHTIKAGQTISPNMAAPGARQFSLPGVGGTVGFREDLPRFPPPSLNRRTASTAARGTLIGMQLWLPLMLGSILPLLRLARHGWSSRRIPAHQCVHCRYDLTGNVSGVCPECGTAILHRTIEGTTNEREREPTEQAPWA